VKNDPLGGEREANNKVFVSINYFIDPPPLKERSPFFEKFVLLA